MTAWPGTMTGLLVGQTSLAAHLLLDPLDIFGRIRLAQDSGPAVPFCVEVDPDHLVVGRAVMTLRDDTNDIHLLLWGCRVSLNNAQLETVETAVSEPYCHDVAELVHVQNVVLVKP